MAQYNWQYISETGKQYIVGLYHGPQSGHLMVHCNSRIVLIDFHVLKSSTYSLFLDDELCELKLERKGDRFHYDFNINREADTPKNRQRKKEAARQLKGGLLIAATLAVVLSIFLFFVRSQQALPGPREKTTLLAQNSLNTIVKVFPDRSEDASQSFRYSFAAGDKIIRGQSELVREFRGMLPLKAGDEFLVRYLGNRPQVHEIDFSRPSKRQLQKYRNRAIEKHATLHPGKSRTFVACLVDQLAQHYGPHAYADIFFQDRPSRQQKKHNRQTFHNLRQDPALLKAMENCR